MRDQAPFTFVRWYQVFVLLKLTRHDSYVSSSTRARLRPGRTWWKPVDLRSDQSRKTELNQKRRACLFATIACMLNEFLGIEMFQLVIKEQRKQRPCQQ